MSSDSDAEGAGERVVTVEADGVRVEKTFERDEFPVPVVSFVISSSADEPVEIRLTDEIPESFPMEHVGFHPDFDSENWTAYRDHRVEFVCTLEPGGEQRTVYGVRLDENEEMADFLGEPALERRGDTTDGDPDDILGRETNQLVRDALAGDEVPGVEGGSGADDEAVAAAFATDENDATADDDSDEEATDEEEIDTEEDTDSDEEEDESADEEAEDEDEGADESVPQPRTADSALTPALVRSDEEDDEVDVSAALVESVAAALAAELRAGTVDDDDVATLRDHLDVADATSEVPKSLDVRLRRVQSKVADLDAYTAALEDFLDENGSGEELIVGFREDVSEVEEELEAIEDELTALRSDQTALEEDIEDVESTVEERATELEATVAERTSELDERMEAVRSDLGSDIDTVESDLGEVDEEVERLSSRIESLEADVTEAEVAEAEELDSLASDVADLEEELADLREFRDRMRNAFGDSADED